MHPTKSQCYSPVENIKILALKIARFVVFERTTLVLKCSSLQQLPKNKLFYMLFCLHTNYLGVTQIRSKNNILKLFRLCVFQVITIR